MSFTPRSIAFLTAVFLVATLVTQVGGFLLVGGAVAGLFWSLVKGNPRRLLMMTEGALTFYLIGLLTVPFLAKPFGRQALPWFASEDFPLRPRNISYCLLFRNYVSPQLAKTLRDCSRSYARTYHGEYLDYLDACFPFIDGFPLLPHLSHDDGRKVDLTLRYSRKGSAVRSPSPIGYWIYEGPRRGESAPCGWSPLRWDFPWLQGLNSHRKFDAARTRCMIQAFSQHRRVQKMFLEPHLKYRLGLGAKVRFQGCKAARHDDHVHVQIY